MITLKEKEEIFGKVIPTKDVLQFLRESIQEIKSRDGAKYLDSGEHICCIEVEQILKERSGYTEADLKQKQEQKK